MYKALKFLLLLLCCSLYALKGFADHRSGDDSYNYHWGRGLNLPTLNLNIGGYFKSSFTHLEFDYHDRVGLDDLSFFITWSPFDRIRFFAEIEQKNWLSNQSIERFSDSLSVERLFVEFLVNTSTTVRFGKYLTPVGRWNVIHSAPLVWTTNRPIITEGLSFAPRANGLLINHSWLINEHNLDVSVYLDDSTDLEPKSNTIVFDKAVGARINYEITEQLQVGASYLAYQKLADLDLPTHYLFGLDALWQHQGFEVLFESLYHFRDDPMVSLDEKGMFLQGVAPLGGKLFAVARYEYFNSNVYETLNNDKVTHVGIGGLAWRPFVPLVLKAEYRFGDNNRLISPSGFFLSIATFY